MIHRASNYAARVERIERNMDGAGNALLKA
jgi:hypothetical protein